MKMMCLPAAKDADVKAFCDNIEWASISCLRDMVVQLQAVRGGIKASFGGLRGSVNVRRSLDGNQLNGMDEGVCLFRRKCQSSKQVFKTCGTHTDQGTD